MSGPDKELQRRLAANESVFRDVNEGIERGQYPGDEREPVGFRCECARLGCNSLLPLTMTDYERIRSNPRRFVMVPGHQLPSVERVVEHGEGWLAVEKTGEAGAEAERIAPD